MEFEHNLKICINKPTCGDTAGGGGVGGGGGPSLSVTKKKFSDNVFL